MRTLLTIDLGHHLVDTTIDAVVGVSGGAHIWFWFLPTMNGEWFQLRSNIDIDALVERLVVGGITGAQVTR